MDINAHKLTLLAEIIHMLITEKRNPLQFLHNVRMSVDNDYIVLA